jgi:hypothetical protein
MTGPVGAGVVGPIGLTGPTGPLIAASDRILSAYSGGVYGPYGTNSTMVGLGYTYTIKGTSGLLFIAVSGLARNSAGNAGTTVELHWQSGAPPPAGAAAVGIMLGASQHLFLANAADKVGWCIHWIGGGFAGYVGQNIWFDLAIWSTTGNNAYVQDLNFVVIEM